MTTATAPIWPKTSPSHLQESLFTWLKPEAMPTRAKPPRQAPAATPTKPARGKTLPHGESAAKAARAPKGPAAPPAPADSPAAPAAKKKRDVSHEWVVAAEIVVTPRIASIADFRGSFKTDAAQRVEALEVYCRGCRRPYDEVKGNPCAAKVDNTHLIGGDQTTRAKRKVPVPHPNARLVPSGTINRRGLDAYVTGVSRTKG